MSKILIFLGLLIIALVERLWLDLGPNIELVMVTSVLASMYLGRKWGAGLAVLTLFLSDLIIGNTAIMIFTWSAFMMIGWGGKWIKKWHGDKQILVAGVYGLISALWFYFYTNFGVWLMTSMYEKTFSGLIKCYTMALPFLRLHAVSNMFLVSGGVLTIHLGKEIVRKSRLRIGKIRFATIVTIFNNLTLKV